MSIHVCFSSFSENAIDRQLCPTCGSEQNFLCRFQEYYGWHKTCLNCGDSWNDGEMQTRPFMRGWRKIAIAKANNTAKSLGLLGN